MFVPGPSTPHRYVLVVAAPTPVTVVVTLTESGAPARRVAEVVDGSNPEIDLGALRPGTVVGVALRYPAPPLGARFAVVLERDGAAISTREHHVATDDHRTALLLFEVPPEGAPGDRVARDPMLREFGAPAYPSYTPLAPAPVAPAGSAPPALPPPPPVRRAPASDAAAPPPAAPEAVGAVPADAARHSSPQRGAEYTVWYGTNRRPVDPARPAAGYGADRDARTWYGACRVFVPRSHKIGSTGSPWWRRLLAADDDRMRLTGVAREAADAHWRSLRDHVAALPADQRDAVVFVHGYNVSFEEAALRAAQIGYDLQLPTMGLFSWPSRGTLQGYAADAASVEASEWAIAAYLGDFAAQSGAARVHVIAHSMGNRGVLRALARLAGAGARLGQVILAAPDVDADVFRGLAGACRGAYVRATLYASARDRAVAASHALYDAPRVGYAPPVTVAPGVDTVVVSAVDLSVLGHGYVAEARDVLHDMYDLLRRDAAPGARMGLRPARTPAGEPYWEVGA